MKKKNEFKVGQVYEEIDGQEIVIEVIKGDLIEYSYKEENEHLWASLHVDSALSRSLTLVKDVKAKPKKIIPKDRFVIWDGQPLGHVSKFFPSFESAEAEAIATLKFESIQSFLVLKVVGEVKEQSSTITTKFE